MRREASGLKVQAFWKTGALIAHIPPLPACEAGIVHKHIYRSVFLIVFRLH